MWGLARLGHIPRVTWMERWLMCAERVIDEFDAEGLSQVWKECGSELWGEIDIKASFLYTSHQVVWALGAMRYVPDKAWLRSLIGQVGRWW